MPSKNTLQQITDYLKFKYEAGLLPAYIFRQQTTPVPLLPAAEALEQLRSKIGDCTRCRLHQGRTHLVFGVGDPNASLMFVGEGPGRDEDLQGLPFVGKAGQLLTKMIQAMGYSREGVYIANVVKCRPPENRNPAEDERVTCSPFLLEQIEVVQPKVIVCLGNIAAQTLLGTEQKISSLRGRLHLWPSLSFQKIFKTRLPPEGISLMPTYHPAFLLRNTDMKKVVWEDLQIVMRVLGKK